jgi:hypothetical protein
MAAVGGLVLIAVIPKGELWFRKGAGLFAVGVGGIVGTYVLHNPEFTHWAAGEIALGATSAVVFVLKILTR